MPPKPKGEYIETDTGNKVSRRSQIHGTQNIILGGKSIIQASVIIRGDLKRTLRPSTSSNSSTSSTLQPSSAEAQKAQQQQQQQQQTSTVTVSIGRYCFLSTSCILRPPAKSYRGQYSYHPLKIGDHVYVGPSAIVEAAVIGSYVNIGEGAIVGSLAIVKDYVRILPGTVVPPGMVIPGFSVVGGCPGRVVADIAEGEVEEMDLRELYKSI